uniref:Secreted protein n=1 Tax=Aegilops tauschii subsp. strangulata TaxID=200361 RepID=A0A453NNK5_AEGTS
MCSITLFCSLFLQGFLWDCNQARQGFSCNHDCACCALQFSGPVQRCDEHLLQEGGGLVCSMPPYSKGISPIHMHNSE